MSIRGAEGEQAESGRHPFLQSRLTGELKASLELLPAPFEVQRELSRGDVDEGVYDGLFVIEAPRELKRTVAPCICALEVPDIQAQV